MAVQRWTNSIGQSGANKKRIDRNVGTDSTTRMSVLNVHINAMIPYIATSKKIYAWVTQVVGFRDNIV